MTRVKSGPAHKARHHKILARTKGFRMTRNRLYKVAHEAYLHALDYAFEGRKNKKRDFKAVWNLRINAGLRAINPGYAYSRFINAAKKANLGLNRKMLALLAEKDQTTFAAVVKKVMAK